MALAYLVFLKSYFLTNKMQKRIVYVFPSVILLSFVYLISKNLLLLDPVHVKHLYPSKSSSSPNYNNTQARIISSKNLSALKDCDPNDSPFLSIYPSYKEIPFKKEQS